MKFPKLFTPGKIGSLRNSPKSSKSPRHSATQRGRRWRPAFNHASAVICIYGILMELADSPAREISLNSPATIGRCRSVGYGSGRRATEAYKKRMPPNFQCGKDGAVLGKMCLGTEKDAKR